MNELKAKLDKQEHENKTLVSNLIDTNRSFEKISKENTNLKSEVAELRKDLGILNSQVTSLTAKNFDLETKMKGLQLSNYQLEEEKKVAELTSESLKKKMVEGEYAAYCYRLKDRSPIDGSLQDVQLVLRLNCQGQPVFEFENKNGDIRILKASLVSDIESMSDSLTRFCIKYKPYGTFGNKNEEYYESENRNRMIGHIKNFLQRHMASQDTDASYPAVSFKRNMLDDLKRLFFG